MPIGSNILVWRENKGWTGPFQLLYIEGETAKVRPPSGPTDFRTTSVKLFEQDQSQETQQKDQEPQQDRSLEDSQIRDQNQEQEQQQRPQRIRQPSRRAKEATETYYTDRIDQPDIEIYIRQSVSLEDQKPGQFERSRRKELNGLIKIGVF